MHFPYNCIVEVVDPDTGKQVGPGETGEIVTTVFDEVYPLIRFGTGDLSYYTVEPCPCGRTTGRIVKILGRTDQVTKVKGMFIHPSAADEVMAAFPDAERYQVAVTREDHVDKMTFIIELKDGVDPSDELAERMKNKGMKTDAFEYHLGAFDYGVPPHAGCGIGLERLIMALTGTENIRDVTFYPRDVDRLTP